MSRQIPLPALGQYSVPLLQAPRVPVPQTNNLLELAKGLNVVSDIVTTYDQIQQTQDRQRQALEKARALKGKEREAYEQALITEGATQFDLDPGGVSRQMEAYEREVRKLAEEGKMPEQANALFMLGAKQAKGKVLANNVYREMLFNPQTISETIDPVQTVQEKRQELFSRPEFQSELVKQAALENIQKVEQDFIKDVNARFDAIDIEDAKTNWLLNGKPLIQQAINGELDINDPSIKNWVNDKVGLFKGSRKYAWENLIKENLEEGLTEGYYKPTAVLGFLKNLRQLDLGGGVKFADAETGISISDFYDDVEERRASLEHKANQRNEIQYNTVLTDISMVLLDEYKRNGSVSKSTLLAQLEKSRELIPHHMRYKLDTEDGPKLLNNINKLKDESSVFVFSDITLQIEQGINLDEVKDTTINAYKTGQLTEEQFDKLNTRIERTRDFDEQILKTDSYRILKDSYNAIITGFNRDLTATEQRRREGRNLGYFQLINFDEQATKATDASTVFNQIKTLKGEFRAQRFVDERYEVFRINLRNSLESMFFEQVGLGKSIQDARNYVIENQADTADKLFKSWSTESINVANTKYLN